MNLRTGSLLTGVLALGPGDSNTFWPDLIELSYTIPPVAAGPAKFRESRGKQGSLRRRIASAAQEAEIVTIEVAIQMHCFPACQKFDKYSCFIFESHGSFSDLSVCFIRKFSSLCL